MTPMSQNEALRESSRVLKSFVIPQLRALPEMEGAYEIVEGNPGLAERLDIQAGVDVIRHVPNDGLQGIASRCQWTTKGRAPYNTFTVRKSRESGAKTEYRKRVDGIADGAIYPELMLQAYLCDRRRPTEMLLSLAVAKTIDVMNLIDEGHYYVMKTGGEQIGQAEFFVVKWSACRDRGLLVVEYQAETQDRLIDEPPVVKRKPKKKQQPRQETLF